MKRCCLGHLTRVVAKLRRTDAGVELIKGLAAGGHISRIVAAGAFAINLAAAPPMSGLSITGMLDPLVVDPFPTPGYRSDTLRDYTAAPAGRVGPPQFPGQPCDRSAPPTPGGS